MSSKPTKKSAKVTVSGWVPSAVANAIRSAAKADDRSTSYIVGEIITDWHRKQTQQVRAA